MTEDDCQCRNCILLAGKSIQPCNGEETKYKAGKIDAIELFHFVIIIVQQDSMSCGSGVFSNRLLLPDFAKSATIRSNPMDIDSGFVSLVSAVKLYWI